ncbi:MAG: PEP-CTERM sorting domain-containing protein [Gemmatimonas sp.]
MKIALRALAAATLLSASALPAQSLLTAEFAGTQATDFLSNCPEQGDYCFTTGPAQVGTNGFSVTFSSPSDNAVYGAGGYYLQTNGTWTTRPLAGTNTGSDPLRLTFAVPVSRVGGFMNYAVFASGQVDGDDPVLSAYDASDNLIASYNLHSLAPISTSGDNEGLFRGIEYAGGITSLELRGGYMITSDLVVSSVNVVPEPSTYALMGAGLLAIAFVRRRRTH